MSKKKERQKTVQKTLTQLSLKPQGKAAITLSAIMPAVQDENTGVAYSPDIASVLTHVIDQSKKLEAGSLGDLEGILLSQAMVLDALFHKSIMDAHKADCPAHKNIFMGMALKAQSQTRSTIEALANIKNPRPFIHQQNMAYRPQVHNGTVLNAYGWPESPVKKSKTTNELLTCGDEDYETLDFGGAGAAIRTDKNVVAMEEFYRAANG